MRIAVLKEVRDGETRVAASPETVKKLVAAGHIVTVEAGAGVGASTPDHLFVDMGATIAATPKATLKDADLVMKVRRPTSDELKSIPSGAGVEIGRAHV